jgi:hypothetical protein
MWARGSDYRVMGRNATSALRASRLHFARDGAI